MQIRHARALLRLSSVVMALIGTCPEINARILSPDEAIEALDNSHIRKISPVAHASIQLAHTVVDGVSGQPTVYVFNGAPSGGFCIAAADDTVGDILLGYSDSSSFDSTALHPGMEWLLEMYSARVAEASARRSSSRSTRVEVPPMSSTMWAQGAPYNDLCPMVMGSRTAAGCVAVAVAQVMKVHQWPASGTGSKEYSYTLVEAESNPTVSVGSDFGAHTYQWDQMLDSYLEGSTAGQREAVAQLAFDCGVAASTAYSSSSSARSIDAGRGMLEHFAYDKGMRYLDRKWFAYSEWEEIIYSQLRQGRPVVYSGSGETTAHTFLIDGADASGFFHFNWGWYGISDGYYSLADLSPADPGDVTRSFNWAQNILVDITPDAGSPLAGCIAIADVLGTNRTVYNADTDYINILGGFYSFALGTVQYSLGLLVDTETPQYVSALGGMLDTTWGYGQMAVYAGSFPEGEYDVYPVFKTMSGEWMKMYYNRSITSGHLHFVKNGSTLTVTGSGAEAPIAGDVVSAVYAGAEPADGIEPKLFPGREYDFVFEVTADGECVKEMNMALVSVDGGVAIYGTPVVVDFSGASSVRLSFPIALPADIEPGTYQVGCMVKSGGENRLVSDYTPVEIHKEWITLATDRLDLCIGDEYRLPVSTNSDFIPVEWSSSDESVARVDADGVIQALAEGTAVITASCGSVSATCEVTVSPVLPDSIEINPKYILIEVGASQKLDVVIYPLNTTDKTLTWTCSAPDRIRVDDDCTITAISAGYAELTATCGDVSATCYISAFAGIGDAVSDKVGVTSSHGMVHVDAPARAVVTVYGIDGSPVYSGTSRDIALPRCPLYIVVVEGIAFKVSVD